MPELPEVENVRLELSKHLLNKKWINIDVINLQTLKGIQLKDFTQCFTNQRLIDVKRYAKYLFFEFENYFLISHLRMEGKWNVFSQNDNYTHKSNLLVVKLEKNLVLTFSDFRKFATIEVIKKDTTTMQKFIEIKKIGPEPWDANLDYFYSTITKKSRPIKTLLLDQSIISGIGNIYADEILYDSKINPNRLGKDITNLEAQNILNSAIQILKKSIELGGSSIRTYTSNGKQGTYQNHLKVHTKENQSCFDGDHFVKKIKINGRGTYFCEGIQK